MNTLELQRVGENNLGYMAYKDENGRYYLDIDMVEGKNPETLYHCCPSDDMDGEPDFPLWAKFEILNPLSDKELRMQHFHFEYSMLSRLKDECEAFVGKTGNEEDDKWDCRYHNVRNIWGTTINDQVSEMKRLWSKIPEDIKPQWCTWEEILELSRKANEIN
uniref:Large polyvalent protein-associated domain-containing protein n=1 Tax=Prevotella sp. GTC17254 TaxID=3236794 RepID=A0AB33J1D5_9BACT